MNSLDAAPVPMESLSPWLKIIVIGTAVMVIIHFELLRYVLELVREICIPWTVTRHMRKLGYSGPSLSLFKNQKRVTQQFQLNAPSGPLLTSTGGLSHDIEPRVFPHIHAWRNLYGENFIFKRGARVQLHASDAEVIKEVLSTKFDDYEKCRAATLVMDILGTKGLGFAEHEEWARQRRVVRPAYYPGKVKEMVVQMASWIEIWLQRMDDLVVENRGSLDVEMHSELYELTKDILARSSFGTSFEKAKEGFEHLDNHKRLVAQQGYHWNPLQRWIPSALKKEISKEKGEVLRCLRQIISGRRNSIQSGNYESYGDDFLGLLLADRDRRLALEGRPPGDLETEDEHITDQCRTVFFAGQDTLYNVSQWAIVFLGHYTDWQERIRAEVQEAFQGGSPDGDQLMKLKQLTMFVDETLRLYSPVSVVSREVFKTNATLRGERLPKHLAVFINFFALHRDKENWGDDALEFKPERFSNGIAMACKTPNAYSPFGWGPRTCVAQSFAMTELKLILAMLVQRFSFRLSPSYRHEPVFGLSLVPKFGVQVVLEHVQPPNA